MAYFFKHYINYVVMMVRTILVSVMLTLYFSRILNSQPFGNFILALPDSFITKLCFSSFVCTYFHLRGLQISFYLLKGCVCYIFASLIFSLNKSPCQTRKNAFYFASKALFVLKKIKFYYFKFSNFMTSSNA